MGPAVNTRLVASTWACLVIVSACASPGEQPAAPRVITLPSGTTVTLPAQVVGPEESDGDRIAIRGEDGVVWSVQAIPNPAERPLDEVAIALAQRVELGEVEGELLHRPCSFGGHSAQCIDGWQLDASGRRAGRAGALVSIGTEVLWLSVASRDEVRLAELTRTLPERVRIGRAHD